MSAEIKPKAGSRAKRLPRVVARAPQERGAVLLRALRDSENREAAARLRRKQKLASAADSCSLERKAAAEKCTSRRREMLERAKDACGRDREHVTDSCGERRDEVRDDVRETIARERSLRRRLVAELEEETRPPTKSRKRKVSRERVEESDSLALHDIPAKYHRLWRRMRRRYPVSLPPDERAQRFMEEVGSRRDELAGSGGLVGLEPERATAYERYLVDDIDKTTARMLRKREADDRAQQKDLDRAEKTRARRGRRERVATKGGRRSARRRAKKSVPF